MPLNSVLFALGYAAVAFFTGISVFASDGFSVTFTFGIGLATISLVACWSVFGTGGFLKRMLVAHGLGAIVGLGIFFAILGVSASGPFRSDEAFTTTLISFLQFTPPFLVAAQLPYWILRHGLGWQFTVKGQPPVTGGFSIRDVFLATFVCAVALGTPQVAINNRVEQTVERQMERGNTRQTNPMLADSKIDEIELKRTQRHALARSLWYAVMWFSLAIFVITWLTIPVLLFTFRAQEPEAGCLYNMMYAVVVLCTVLVLILAGGTIFAGGPPPRIAEPMIYLGSAVAVTVGALAAPLLISRNCGLTLTSPKRYQKQLSN